MNSLSEVNMMNADLLERCHIKEATTDVAVKADDVVKLRIGLDCSLSSEPISIPKLLHQIASKYPNRPALAFRDDDNKWSFITYRKYQEKVLSLARVFIKLGLEARTSVGIFAYNCPEWHYAEMAAIHAGAIVAGIYITNSAEAVRHILSTSNATVAIVGESKHMENIRSVKDQLPALKTIIQISGPFDACIGNESGYYRWSDIEKIDASDMNDKLSQRLNEIAVNECCCLVYTSGTVGFPKAVMLSHDCIIWNSSRVVEVSKIVAEQKIYLSYLPLSHMAAQIFDIFVPIIEAGCVYFAESDALKGSLLNVIQQVRPTQIFAVPRMWEKIQENLDSIEKRSSKLYQMLLRWARTVVFDHNMKILKGKFCSCWKYWFAEKIVRTMKLVNGLDRGKWFLTGGAPTDPNTKEYFLSLDMMLSEAYGMSETSGVISLGDKSTPNFEAAGKVVPGIQIRIDNPNKIGHGEICVKTRSTFMGYLNQLDKTEEVIDEDDWVHSGDIGYLDDDGYLYITGRLKEILITAGGENIPPIRIENLVKKELPGISNALLIGDRKKFLSILLTIKTESDPNTGAPSNKLQQDAIEWMSSLGVEHETLSDILNAGPCPKVMESIQQGINRANKNAISNAQKVQKFAILPHDFSIPTNELGPTLKVKRNVIVEKYQDIIEGFYN